MASGVGEETTLAKNSPKFASLRTTIPMSIVRQWQLKEGDKLDWSWEARDGEMILVVRRKRVR
ncbi:MAG TPA: AbrB/MazE/SpoVT family DNA-binding domain-containing protein [Candidatus Nitrosopolaris sp.]|nr:AbrB/MazE/SpoVT family DNA-binding domain-containing protein [Candidatus Nitrosopolaris sp.]